MPLVLSIIVVSLLILLILLDRLAQRKIASLANSLPRAYNSALAGAPDGCQLVPLSIDLLRKQRCSLPYDTLTAQEQRIALHALAVHLLPAWVISTATWRLTAQEKTIIVSLTQIKTSRPVHKETHFGAIKAQLQLRSVTET